MNEITRIHIAKVAYDIEVAAKKKLQTYIKQLEEYTADGEVLMDIEIRMTELLSERKVLAGGVISTDDVDAIRAQLGEPYEFSEEAGDIAVGPVNEDTHPRRFYRDLHNALLGGVLSGIALYTNSNVLWVRLAFIVLLFASFGIAFFGYLILWVIVPPAHTATQRLRQEGQPVTLQAIRAIKEKTSKLVPSATAPMVQRALCVMFGLLSALGAAGVATLLALGVAGGVVGIPHFDVLGDYGTTWVGITMVGLIIFGMSLLVALLSLAAYSFFTQKITRRMVVSGVVIIVLGMVAFVGTLGLASMQSMQLQTNAERMMQTTKKQLPEGLNSVTNVNIAALQTDNVVVDYVVSKTYSYELVALPKSKVTMNVEGTIATFMVTIPQDSHNAFVQPRLIIRGPALAELTADGAMVRYENKENQAALKLIGKRNSTLALTDGTYGAVTVEGAGMIDTSGVTVSDMTVNGRNGLELAAGTVRTLNVTLPQACPSSSDGLTRVEVAGITSDTYILNGSEQRVVTHKTNCAIVAFGDDEDDAEMIQ